MTGNSGRSIVLTGATAGIGRALMHALAPQLLRLGREHNGRTITIAG